MTGPDFVAVGGGDIDLTSLKVAGTAYEAGASAGDVEIQVLKFDGSVDAAYTWLDLEGDFEPGWYNADTEMIEPDTVKFSAGDGLWVQGLDDLNLVYNGEVLQKTAVTIPLRFGHAAGANPFPVALDLTKISVGGEAYEAGGSAGDVEIQLLKFDGSVDVAYTWLDLDGDFEPGWYDADTEPIEENTVFLPAGMGLWIQGLEGLELQIPALTL